MKRVEVMAVRVEMPTNKPIVLLRDLDGDLYVPVWVGAPEATAIAYAQQGVTPPRPLTHDLLLNTLQQLGHELTRVEVVRLHENVFYAELVIDQSVRVSARTSDAVAIALRAQVPVLVADDIFAAVGVNVPGDGEEDSEQQEDEVERFREFLDTISPEDFDNLPGDPGTPADGDTPA